MFAFIVLAEAAALRPKEKQADQRAGADHQSLGIRQDVPGLLGHQVKGQTPGKQRHSQQNCEHTGGSGRNKVERHLDAPVHTKRRYDRR